MAQALFKTSSNCRSLSRSLSPKSIAGNEPWLSRCNGTFSCPKSSKLRNTTAWLFPKRDNSGQTAWSYSHCYYSVTPGDLGVKRIPFETDDGHQDDRKELGGVLENLPAAAVSESRILAQALAARALMAGLEVRDLKTLDEIAGLPDHKVRSMISKDPRLSGGMARILADKRMLSGAIITAVIEEASATKVDLVKGTTYFSGLSCRPRVIFLQTPKLQRWWEHVIHPWLGQDFTFSTPQRFPDKGPSTASSLEKLVFITS